MARHDSTEVLWTKVYDMDHYLEPGMVWIKVASPKRQYRISLSEYNKLWSTGRIVV